MAAAAARDGCPCCEDRIGKRGGFRFLLKSDAPLLACGECVVDTEAIDYGPDAPPFRWPRTPDAVDAAVAQVVEEQKRVLDEVAALGADPANLTFARVITPLMHLPCYKTNPLVCQAKHLQHCSPDPVVREAATKATTVLAKCKKESKTRKDVYEVVRAFNDAAKAGKVEAPTDYEAHFVRTILLGFERGGLGLSEADAAKLKDFLDEDAEVCNKYKRNLSEDNTRISLSPGELEGCDADWVKEKTGEGGAVELTLKYPDILPVLQNCEVAGTREKIAMARETAYGNNLDLVAEGVQLRKKAAGVLGYQSWSHFVIRTRMAGSPERVHEFLGGILDKAKPGATRDRERLRQLKIAHLKERGELGAGGEDGVDLDSWDVSFYHSLLLKREYGVDHEAIRKYFPCPVVVQGTLEIYQELLGLKFTELFSFDTWHPDVRLFVVHDAASGAKVGNFYLDLHPRDGKYTHAAIFHLLKSKRLAPGGEWQTPVDCMLTNLPAPGADGKPALLRHDDVVTFFHEFGHIMHGLCSEGTGNSTTLAKCPRDFVEAPSQMLENWCFNETVLSRLSSHVDTKEPLPSQQVQNLLRAKNVSEGLMMLRQLYLGLLDLEIHGAQPPSDAAGLQALVDRLRPEVSLLQNPPGCNMLRNFGHLMNQYSAAYYGYLWAEVISADMFESRFEKDPFSKEAGMAYRKTVLAPGGVDKISDHLERFLGRPPTQDPFLRSRGII